MPTTLGSALDSIRARLNEPVSVYWDDQDLRRWCNEILKDMARRTECLRGLYNQTAVVGTTDYIPAFTLTTNVYRIYRVEFIPTGQSNIYPLEFRDPNACDEIWGLAQQQTEGIPAIWTSWGTPPALTLKVFPGPSVAGTLRLWYYRLPANLSISGADDAENLDLVEGWDDVLTDGVEYKALRRDSDPRWQEAKAEYESHLEAMAEATIRFTDSAGMISTNSGTFIPQWLYGGGVDLY